MSIVLLARDLGLSISTVSRALNGYDDVSPATRERILENGRRIGQSLLRLLRGDAKPADIHYLEPVVLVPRKSDGPCAK